eukprot:TRINITY_DN56833_c0_g1_i1.p4 TRINITY_DN56833_c0_g1~~TRINITY_DN56833_c0_g1_i1.p4  ORF type:complete len:146 (+),score=28.90 TRINITY_DN56833_c0_g1_i1:158-595(+)
MLRSLVGSEMCIRDSVAVEPAAVRLGVALPGEQADVELRIVEEACERCACRAGDDEEPRAARAQRGVEVAQRLGEEPVLQRRHVDVVAVARVEDEDGEDFSTAAVAIVAVAGADVLAGRGERRVVVKAEALRAEPVQGVAAGHVA